MRFVEVQVTLFCGLVINVSNFHIPNLEFGKNIKFKKKKTEYMDINKKKKKPVLNT